MSEPDLSRRKFLLGLSAAGVTGAGLGLAGRLGPLVGSTSAAYLDSANARTASLGVIAAPVFMPGFSRNAHMRETGVGLGTDGNVYMWGRTDLNVGGGMVGAGTGKAPQAVPGLPAIRQVSAQPYDASALDAAGTVWAWGNNDVRNGTEVARPSQNPKQIRIGTAWNGTGAVLDKMIGLASTEYAGAGIRSDGTIWHWGYATGWGGNTGDGAAKLVGLPDPTVAGNRPVYLKGGYTNFFLMLENGDVWYWGGAGGNSLPPGVGNVDSAPVLLSVLNPWMKKNVTTGSPYIVALEGGVGMGGALMSNGRVLSWGSDENRTGRAAGSGTAAALIPAASLSNVVSMQFSFYGAEFLTNVNDLYGYDSPDNWGRNPLLPVRLAQNVAQYAAGHGHYMWQIGTGASAVFWARGWNDSGAIGLPTGSVGNTATATTDSRVVTFASQTPATLTPVRI